MKLSKTKRRIAICKDALEQIKLGLYKVKQGTYVYLLGDLADKADGASYFDNLDGKTCMLDAAKDGKPYCEACAKGAIFASLVRKENNVKLCSMEYETV